MIPKIKQGMRPYLDSSLHSSATDTEVEQVSGAVCRAVMIDDEFHASCSMMDIN